MTYVWVIAKFWLIHLFWVIMDQNDLKFTDNLEYYLMKLSLHRCHVIWSLWLIVCFGIAPIHQNVLFVSKSFNWGSDWWSDICTYMLAFINFALRENRKFGGVFIFTYQLNWRNLACTVHEFLRILVDFNNVRKWLRTTKICDVEYEKHIFLFFSPSSSMMPPRSLVTVIFVWPNID